LSFQPKDTNKIYTIENEQLIDGLIEKN